MSAEEDRMASCRVSRGNWPGLPGAKTWAISYRSEVEQTDLQQRRDERAAQGVVGHAAIACDTKGAVAGNVGEEAGLVGFDEGDGDGFVEAGLVHGLLDDGVKPLGFCGRYGADADGVDDGDGVVAYDRPISRPGRSVGDPAIRGEITAFFVIAGFDGKAQRGEDSAQTSGDVDAEDRFDVGEFKFNFLHS